MISRDVCETVEQDLALVQISLMFLGTVSGPKIMAILGDLPYLIYGFRSDFPLLREKLVPGG